MPKRTNLFQEVVEIIHRHMAGDATVEASAMLRSKSTGSLREVDVVIRAEQAGHEVIVAVEAMARSRKADRGWVDRMVGTHADLPTSKLVLVSQKGFTADARAAALANNAVPLAPEDLSSSDHARDVVAALPALWPKMVSFTIESLNVWFAEDAPNHGWDENPPTVFIEDGSLGNLMEFAQQLYKANWLDLMEQMNLRNVAEDAVQQFTFEVGSVDGEDIRLPVDGAQRTVYILNADGRGYSFRRLTAVGRGVIKVSEIPLTHGRLGDVKINFGYGEGKIGDQDALLVVTERDEGGGHLTVRFRPVESEDESATSPDHQE